MKWLKFLTTEKRGYWYDYYGDSYGNPVDDDSGDIYEFGNIYIETANKKYIFQKVSCAYLWVSEIIDYIENHKNEDMIFINLNELQKTQDGKYDEFEDYSYRHLKVELTKSRK